MPTLAPALALTILRYSSLVVVTWALFQATYAVAVAPTRVVSRLGLRGLKRQRAASRSDAWALIEPLVRWLGVRVSGLVTDRARVRIDEQLAFSGDRLGLTADEFVALSVVSTAIGIAAGTWAGVWLDLGPVGVIFGTLLGAATPWMQVTGVAQERLRAISRALPQTTDLMAMAMSAGLDFPGAVRQVVDKSSNPEDPMVEELTILLQGLSIGRTRKDALVEFMRRIPTEVVKEFCAALIQAEERGNPVAEVLQIQATTARTRRSVRAEELAAKAGVQITVPLMLVFACVLGLVLGPALLNIIESGGVQ
jgi:tight adherence protein C